MSRPVPLFEAPELLTRLSPGPLDTAVCPHARYLRDAVAGEVLVVARSEERLARLGEIAGLSPSTTSVTERLNDTGSREQIKQHSLDLRDDRRFDTVVYAKEATAWFGRSPDFHRLTPLLKAGGTLLAKTKWVPDSDRLSLEEIAVTGAFSFQSPEVYLRWTKQQHTLSGFSSGGTETVMADGEGETEPSRAVDGELRAAAGEEASQFAFDRPATEYSPGWSWHSKLKRHVEAWVDAVDGRVANLCCGSSTLGDVRVDLLREYTDNEGEVQRTAANVQGDATSVPLPRNSCAAVISDPPWKVPPELRAELFSECQRLARSGGSILHNAWWVPHHPYATPSGIRPAVANVTDTSVGGPGGLSFLTEYEVHEQPDLGDATYSLADHIEECGLSHTQQYRDARSGNPWETPENDPRFVSPGGSYECRQCGRTQFRPVSLPRGPVYECRECGFRSSAGELVESAR